MLFIKRAVVSQKNVDILAEIFWYFGSVRRKQNIFISVRRKKNIFTKVQ